MITKNKNLSIIAVLAVTASITIGIFVSTYMEQGANAQNQSSTSNTGVVILKNLTGFSTGISKTVANNSI